MITPTRRALALYPHLFAFFSACAILPAREGCAVIQPRIVDTVFPTDDVAVASLTVSPPAEQTEDASAAIQAAIDEVAGAGGGVVFLPAGRYLLTSGLVVREGVTVRGDWTPPTSDAAAQGTVLMITAGRGQAEGPPAITLERGSGIREVTLWYPDQRPEEIVPYPWAICTSGAVSGDNYTVHNVTLVNPYQGIKVGPEWNELHTIRNVYGTPLKTGLSVDTCTDIGRLIEVDFSPLWWETSGLPGAPTEQAARTAVRQFISERGTAFDIGRSDWEYIYRVRASGYALGFVIRPGAQGTANAVMFGAELVDCGTALLLQGLNDIGLSATGCRFSGRGPAVHAPPTFNATAQLNSCVLSSDTASGVLLEGDGTITFQNCTFDAWADWAVDAPAGQLSVMGCNFPWPSTHVRLGPAVRRARLLGNTFPRGPVVVDETRDADVQIAHEGFQFARPDVTPHPSPPDPRPATRELFVVTDFGAAPGAQDNTDAFLRALDAARQAGGGTVYVPAGNYRFAGELVVPSGVELRGCFDVPHHTISAGSVLMPTSGRGDENGTPFIRLEPGSGLRGLTVWYPEQDMANIVPYPWAVQGLGPGCWLLDVTMGNAYQGVDFWTYPSDGHLVRYLAGAYFRRGLFISKCGGDGWVEDTQFNPHYAARLHPSLPRAGESWDPMLRYMWEHLDGIVFGRCEREHVRGTFLYAAYDGLAFRDDGGGANARLIQHGTDAGSRGVVLEAAGPDGLEFINAQIVHFGPREQAALVVDEAFTGEARFFNSQMWAGPRSGQIAGSGEVLIQQLNTLTGPFTLSGGRCTLENAHFTRNLKPHVTVEAGCQEARLVGNIARDVFRIVNHAGPALYARANSLSPMPSLMPATFRTGWEEGEPQGQADTLATPGGGIRGVSGATCRPEEGEARSGRRALRLAGNADDPGYSFVYFRVFDQPLAVWPDSVLSYWIRPKNDLGRHVGVDLLFSDGSTLRDSGVAAQDGVGTHPGTARGVVGEWTQVTIPLGKAFAGRIIAAVMVAYDSRGVGGGPFTALVDDLELSSALGELPWQVEADPSGGVYQTPLRVTLTAAQGVTIRYTTDGTPPDGGSPIYAEPIVIQTPGLWDLRYTAQAADGAISGVVQGQLYELR